MIPTTDEEKALLILGGFECSKCGKPFRETVVPKKGEKGYQKGRPPEGYDGHICCKTVHCPFCASPASAHCRHLLAYRTGDKHWVFPGLTLQIGIPSDDYEVNQVWQLLRPTLEEAHVYFGDLAPLVEQFYDKSTNPQAVLSEMLIQKCHWSNTQSVRLEGQGWRYHAFAEDAEVQQAQVKAVMNRVREGFRQWKHKSVPDRVMLAQFLIPPRPLYQPSLFFDATGRYLLSHQNWDAAFWDTNTSHEGREIRLKSRDGQQQYGKAVYEALAFRVLPEADSTCQLRFTIRAPLYRKTDWELIGETLCHMEQVTDLVSKQETLREMPERGVDATEEGWTPTPTYSHTPGTIPAKDLEITLQEDKQTLLITGRAADGKTREERYTFRSEIASLQLSPDKRRVVMLISQRAILWELAQ